MRRITTGDLTKALLPCLPIVTEDMVRVWAERGILHCWRNPGTNRGWWYVDPATLPNALTELGLPVPETVGVLQRLGLDDSKQTKLL